MRNRLLALEVSQKSKMSLPCCMGSKKKKVFLMQRQDAISYFCDTSRARSRFSTSLKRYEFQCFLSVFINMCTKHTEISTFFFLQNFQSLGKVMILGSAGCEKTLKCLSPQVENRALAAVGVLYCFVFLFLIQ